MPDISDSAFLLRVSDRLAELQRQRALAQEQLAWFDREIARETGQAPVAVAPTAAPIPAGALDQAAKEAAAARAADDIIARYKKEPGNAVQDARKGCYLWFALLMVTVVLFAAGVYLLYRAK